MPITFRIWVSLVAGAGNSFQIFSMRGRNSVTWASPDSFQSLYWQELQVFRSWIQETTPGIPVWDSGILACRLFACFWAYLMRTLIHLLWLYSHNLITSQRPPPPPPNISSWGLGFKYTDFFEGEDVNLHNIHQVHLMFLLSFVYITKYLKQLSFYWIFIMFQELCYLM